MATRTWRPDEPARQALYRKLIDRMHCQDGQITYLLDLVRRLEKRVQQLEFAAAAKSPSSRLTPMNPRFEPVGPDGGRASLSGCNQKSGAARLSRQYRR